MAVQRVVRPHLDFRGFAGQIAAGTLRPGDHITALPSGRSSRIARIVTFDGDLPEASAPLSITVTLDDEIDISRGDLLVAPDLPATVATSFTASLVWMDTTPLDLTRRYLLKHLSRTVQAQVRTVLHAVDLSDLQEASTTSLAINGIGLVELETLLPLAADPYAKNRHTGSFVLIDPQTNATVAAGMLRKATAFAKSAGNVTDEDRRTRFGHTGTHLHLAGPASFARSVERALFDLGANVAVTEEQAAPALAQAGLIAITAKSTPIYRVTLAGETTLFTPAQSEDPVQATLVLLRTHAVLDR